MDNIMRNTFAVVTNRCGVEDIDEVINYFENTEEYENCMQLVYIKDDKIGELLTKKLMRNAL